MGRQKIERLLAQLQDNTQEDIKNATAIFTVAQSAVNQLSEVSSSEETATEEVAPLALPASPSKLTKTDLVSCYGSYNACRSAAKKAGLTFSRTPTWEQMLAGFAYLEACQDCIDRYLKKYPNPQLKGMRVTLSLDT